MKADYQKLLRPLQETILHDPTQYEGDIVVVNMEKWLGEEKASEERTAAFLESLLRGNGLLGSRLIPAARPKEWSFLDIFNQDRLDAITPKRFEPFDGVSHAIAVTFKPVKA